MSDLYLSSIQLEDFRAFGAQQRLALTQGPGVTILSGPNGLGKSTVVESIEWALTGTIQRLENVGDGKLNQIALMRVVAGGGKKDRRYGVELIFKKDEQDKKIFRYVDVVNGKISEFIHSDPNEIVEYLVDKKWKLAPGSMGAYLHLTHFQSQSGATRFSGLNPKERWERLRGPAGLNTLSLAQERLANTTRAFNEEIDNRETQHKLAVESLSKFKDLLSRRDLLKLRIQSQNSLSPENAFVYFGSHNIDLGTYKNGFGTVNDVYSFISDSQNSIEVSLLKIDQGLDRLKHLKEIPLKVREATLEIERISLSKSRIDNDIDENRSKLSKETILKEGLDSTLRRLKENLLLQENELKAFSNFASGKAFLSDSDQQINELSMSIENLDKDEKNKIGDYEVSNRKLHDKRSITLEILRVNERIDDLNRLKAQVYRVAQNVISIDSLKSVKEDLESKIAIYDVQISDLETMLAEIQVEFLNQSKLVAAEKSRTNEMGKAIALILSHLKDRDINCPVCRTSFGEGELLKKAEIAINASAQILAPLEKYLMSLKEKIAAIKEEHISAVRDRERLVAEKGESEVKAMQIEQERTQTLQNPVLFGCSIENASTHIDVKIQELQNAALDGKGKLDNFPDDQILLSDMAVKKGYIEALRDDRNIKKDKLEELKRGVVKASGVVKLLSSNYPHFVGENFDDDSFKSKLADSIAVNASRVEELVETLQQVEANLSLLISTTNNLSLVKQDYERKILSLVSVQNSSIDLWRKDGLEGLPDDGVLERKIDSLNKDRSLRSGQLLVLKQAQERISEFESNQSLLAIEHEIKSEIQSHSADDEADVLVLREESVKKCEDRIEKYKSFKDGIIWLTEKLSVETERYAKEILEPLNGLQQRFLSALSSHRRWDVKNLTKTTARKTELSLKISMLNDNHQSKLDADEVLSEGQMAAVTLAQLLSMSTAYKWSHWRALLLDAPTQHNDLIHVTSFIEVIRNLVLDMNYQIVICSHDLEEAEFIRRKLSASKINIVEHRFESHSNTGVAIRSY